MPLFILTAYTKPGTEKIREQYKVEHTKYVRANSENVLLSGPMLNEDDKMPCGTMTVFKFDNIEKAREWARNEPYCANGAYKDVQIHHWMHFRGGLPHRDPPAPAVAIDK